MNSIETSLISGFINAFEECYGAKPEAERIQIQKTKKEFDGDFTVNVFPFLKLSKSKPEETAEAIGAAMTKQNADIKGYNVIKGFLNISLNGSFWTSALKEVSIVENYGFHPKSGDKVLVEFSSPNTNKPLHLGHLRNIFLGDSVSNILSAAGKEVVRTQIINDRGIHICKSMVAYEEFSPEDTPESTGLKGDRLVGDFYVRFDKEYKKQVGELIDKGHTKEEAKEEAPLMQKARETLKKVGSRRRKNRGFMEKNERLGLCRF